jgi:hypothetical protein
MIVPGALSQVETYSAPAVTAKAVHLDGSTFLTLAAMPVLTNNAYFSFAGWYKTVPPGWSNASVSPVGWGFDFTTSGGLYAPSLQGHGFSGSFYPTFYIGASTGATRMQLSNSTEGVWQHFIGTCDLQHAAGSKRAKVYISNVDASNVLTGDTAPAQNVLISGKNFVVGAYHDESFTGDYWRGDMCDISFWPGHSFFDTSGNLDVGIRRLFIDISGHWIAPSVAIAALGTPPIMLSGGASTFRLNSLGNAGALTVAAGALTDASTAPS